MKVGAMLLVENKGWYGFLWSLLFVRVVHVQQYYYRTTWFVLGVPPWRKLTSNDVLTKKIYDWKF